MSVSLSEMPFFSFFLHHSLCKNFDLNGVNYIIFCHFLIPWAVTQCLIDWCRPLRLTREISFLVQMLSKRSLISHFQKHSLLCLYYTAVQLLEDIAHEVDRYRFEMDQ
jgi:hypothetical protein